MSITQYEQNLRQSIEEHQRIIDAGLPESAQAQEIIDQFQGELNRISGQTQGSASDLQRQADDAAMARQRQQQDYENAVRAAQESQRRQNAIATLRGLMTEFGLNSLMAKIEQYVVDGYDADAVMVLIRTTPEYNQRFPAMAALSRKGRAISEAAYIEYEKTASGLERQYGLPAGMLMGNVTELLEKEVSSAELNDRVLLAASSAYQMPTEFRTQFQEYYGIDSGGLTAYFLDPDIATPLLQRQYGASMIGAEAARQNVGVQVGLAEELQSLGVSQEQARAGFGEVAGRRGLTEGRGDIVSQEQLVRGSLAGDEAAMQQIERAAGARVGRFRENAGFVASERGVVGLGSSTTT